MNHLTCLIQGHKPYQQEYWYQCRFCKKRVAWHDKAKAWKPWKLNKNGTKGNFVREKVK